MNDCNSLLERTQYLLKTRPRALLMPEISAATGLGLPWLWSFSSNQSRDYGVLRVQKLHDYLVAKQSEVV